MKKVFVDTEIILDLLAERSSSFYSYAAQLFSKSDRNEITLFVSTLSFSNLNYILARQYNSNEARKKMLQFKTLVTVLPVNEKNIDLALASDFEDALQYFTALENGVNILLTRNLKDYKTAELPVMTAEQYLSSNNKK